MKWIAHRRDGTAKRRWILILIFAATMLCVAIGSGRRRAWYTGVCMRVWPDEDQGDLHWIVVLGSNHGSLYAGVSHHSPVRRWFEFENNNFGPPGYNPFAHQAGFGLIWTGAYHTVFIPWWFAAALSALACAYAVPRLIRVRPPGVCRHCGYDLRATPTRCPECGRITEQPATASQ